MLSKTYPNRKQLGYIRKPSDYLALLFGIAAGISLLITPNISSLIQYRLVLVGIVLYFVTQIVKPTLRQMSQYIHIMGAFTIVVASLSVLYVLAPDLMTYIADKYFSGTADSYGLIVDYERGRILHWGSIVITFPFFYSSVLILKDRSEFLIKAYIVIGFFLLSTSMVISNFRWILLCFVCGTFLFTSLSLRRNLIRPRVIVRAGIFLIIIAFVGLTLASSALDYNVLDRFLLKNSHRDVAETFGRWYLYKQAIDVFLYAPFTGVGIGNYRSVVIPFQFHRYFSKFDQITYLPEPIASHNEFLTLLAETGIVGFLSFLMFTIISTKTSAKLTLIPPLREHRIEQLLKQAAFVSFVLFIMYTLFENIGPNNYIYIFILSGIVFSWFSTTQTTNN